MTIAEELQARKAHLLSPGVTWVARCPREPTESCLGFDGDKGATVSQAALKFLDRQVYGSGGCIAWQDRRGRTFSEVMAMLDDAIIAAKEAGV